MQNTNNKVLFVDCFNTILGRTKTPEDVLLDWAKCMHKEYNDISYIDFFRLFNSCWKTLTEQTLLKIENSEFLTTTYAIFNKMSQIIQSYNLIQNFNSERFVLLAQKVYFQQEHQSHYAKTKTLNYLAKKKAKGYKIYVVSDFYCHKNVIKEWLIAINIDTTLFDDIFVSCDLGCSKKSGSIYTKLLEILNLKPKQVKMIGDNPFVDCIEARKKGLSTKSVKPFLKRKSKELRKTKHQVIIPQEYTDIFNENLQDGAFPNYAFPLYLFTKKLADQCIQNNYKNVFFLARDGLFLKKLFDEYCTYHKLSIKSHYFVVSRLSALNASTLPYEQTFKGLSDKPFISPKNFLKTLMLNDDDIEQILKEAKVKHNLYYLNLSKSRAYQRILNSKIFQKIYDSNRIAQNKAFIKYTNSFGVDYNKEKFVIVDSGWFGSMTKHMKKPFSDTSIEFDSYYIGCLNKNSRQDKTYGLMFSYTNRKLWENKIFYYRRFNYEEFLRTEYNSCIRYNSQTNQPVLDNGDLEKQTYIKYIHPLQSKILDKFKKIMSIDAQVYSTLNAVVAKLTYLIFKNLNKKDKEFFVNIQHTFADNFGYVGYSYKNFSKFMMNFNYWIKDKHFLLTKKKYINKKRLFFD